MAASSGESPASAEQPELSLSVPERIAMLHQLGTEMSDEVHARIARGENHLSDEMQELIATAAGLFIKIPLRTFSPDWGASLGGRSS